MLKKFLVGIVVLSFSFTAFSQNIEGVNARLDAIAGSGIIDDIGWTIDHPSGLYAWPNQVQGTICLMNIPGIGKTFGAIIGIVQFTEMLYVGVTLNNRLNMPAKFYEEGALFIDAIHIDGTDYAKGFPNIPDVNICLKFSDNFKLGIGGFFEGSHYSHTTVTKRDYATSDTTTKTMEYTIEDDNKKVRNYGANIEARITIGPLTLVPQFSYGFPRIGGTRTTDQLSQLRNSLKSTSSTGQEIGTDATYTWDTPEAMNMRGALYAWTDIGSVFWLAGVVYSNWRYQFCKNTDSLTQTLNTDGTFANEIANTNYDSIPSDHNEKWFDWFLAFAPSFSDNLYFSPEYNGGWGTYTGKDPNTAPDTTFNFMYHSFRLGMERPIKNVWFFDELTPRAGISAQWNKEWRSIKNFNSSISQDDESIPWKSFFWGSDFNKKEAKVTGGLGFKKGRGQFDISCDFLNWQGQGVLSGPAAAMATITCDFSRQFNSADAVETPAPDSSPPAAVSSTEEPADEPGKSTP